MGDLSINCEACHGPGAAHVAFWRAAAEDPQLAMQPERSLPDLSRLSPRQQVEACAQCHALKVPLRSGYVPGDDYWDYYELRLIDTDDAFWPDGLAKKLAYPYLQFGSSACFLMAGLTCTGLPCDARQFEAVGIDRGSARGGALCALSPRDRSRCEWAHASQTHRAGRGLQGVPFAATISHATRDDRSPHCRARAGKYRALGHSQCVWTKRLPRGSIRRMGIGKSAGMVWRLSRCARGTSRCDSPRASGRCGGSGRVAGHVAF